LKQLERITFHYVGLDGKLKELKIPVTSLSQAETILAEGERVDGSSLYKGLVDMGLSDLYVVPVYNQPSSILLMKAAWILLAVIWTVRVNRLFLRLIISWPEPTVCSGKIQA